NGQACKNMSTEIQGWPTRSAAAFVKCRTTSARGLDLFHNLVQGRVDCLFARRSDPLVSDHATGIDDIERRGVRQVPLVSDWTRAGVAWVLERPPGHVLLIHHILKILGVASDVHADQGEGLVFQVRYERPLVGPLAPSSQSVFGPEVEQDDLTAVVV